MQVMQTFFCSFNLPNFPTQKIITGDFACKGNGITLGLSDGTHNVGLALNNSSNSPFMVGGLTNYGTDVGTRTGAYSSSTLGYTYGITTDPTKSGIITDTSGFTSVNVCIKF